MTKELPVGRCGFIPLVIQSKHKMAPFNGTSSLLIVAITLFNV